MRGDDLALLTKRPGRDHGSQEEGQTIQSSTSTAGVDSNANIEDGAFGGLLPDVEAFMGLAELGLGLAGFSGIALALATRQQEFQRSDRLLIAFLLLNSLGVSGLAVLPVAGGMLGFSPAVVWRTCSGFHLACSLAVFWPFFGPHSTLSPPLFLWSMRFNFVVVNLLQLLNTTGWLFEPTAGLYFLAVFLILPGTGFAFGRLLFEFLRRRAA